MYTDEATLGKQDILLLLYLCLGLVPKDYALCFLTKCGETELLCPWGQASNVGFVSDLTKFLD